LSTFSFLHLGLLFTTAHDFTRIQVGHAIRLTNTLLAVLAKKIKHIVGRKLTDIVAKGFSCDFSNSTQVIRYIYIDGNTKPTTPMIPWPILPYLKLDMNIWLLAA
jgi:hypothetical protein